MSGVLQDVVDKAETLYSLRAFFHYYTNEGLEESEFTDALEDIKTLAHDYLFTFKDKVSSNKLNQSNLKKAIIHDSDQSL